MGHHGGVRTERHCLACRGAAATDPTIDCICGGSGKMRAAATGLANRLSEMRLERYDLRDALEEILQLDHHGYDLNDAQQIAKAALEAAGTRSCPACGGTKHEDLRDGTTVACTYCAGRGFIDG